MLTHRVKMKVSKAVGYSVHLLTTDYVGQTGCSTFSCCLIAQDLLGNKTEAHLQTFHLTGFQLNLMSFFLLQLSVTAWPFAGCSFLFLYWTSYYIAGTLPCHLYSGGSNTSEAMLV